MLRRVFTVGTLFGAMLAAGCNKDDIPAGTAGQVIVRAFVDTDGSGTYTAGDVAIAGSVTLTASDGTKMQATADTAGQATFTQVMPGSYTATLTGTPPSGAVLATASAPVVVVPFAGGNVAGQFRYVFNPGSIDGVVYRDDNGNGTFDAATDTPAPGLTVNLLVGTSEANSTLIATTTTSATGQYHFGVVRPGTYVLEVLGPPTVQFVGGVTSTVVVTAAVAAQAPRQFTGNLLITIAQARAATVGSTVAIEGIAVAGAGLVGSNQLYIEDAATGILVFGAPTVGILPGDDVRVVGVTSIFNGELEVVAPTGGTLSVTKVSSGTAPAPKTITVTQLLSSSFLGQLVAVPGARVRSVATTGATSYNVNFVGNTAADTFQVRVGNTTTVPIPSTFWEVGRAYDLTGIDGIFNGEHQLKVRASSDVVVGALTLTIAQARTHPANDTVNVVGVVYAGTSVYTLPTAAAQTMYIEDASGGAVVFGLPIGTPYVAGDSVSVRGIVAFFSGEYEISRFTTTSLPVVSKLGTGATVQPKTITTTDFAAKTYDGQLIRVNGLQVVSVSTPSASGGYNVVTTALDGTSVTIRIDASPVGILNTFWVVGTRYDVTGAALNFVSGATTTPEVKPRSPADVSLSNVNVKTIAAAKLISNDTVTFEGIVTAGRGTFRVDNAYVQDGTSGVQIFNLPLSLALAVGDAVRVHGKMTVFSGESEVTNNIAITDSIKVTKLGPGGTPPAKVLTGAQFLARTFEGQLVTLPSVTILTISTPGSTGTYTVTATAQDGSPVTIFMSAPTGAVPTPAATYAIGSRYTVTGIAVPFGTPSVAELKPRGAADVVPGP